MTITGQHYNSYTEARSHLKDLLDAAEESVPATVRREHKVVAVVDAENPRKLLVRAIEAKAGPQVVAEANGWSVFMPDAPVSADGSTLDEALDEMIVALREYANDWTDHLRHAPNHHAQWGLVQMVSLSSDSQLRDWLRGSAT
jgi:predicted RNase H-like HicB family nuclease